MAFLKISDETLKELVVKIMSGFSLAKTADEVDTVDNRINLDVETEKFYWLIGD